MDLPALVDRLYAEAMAADLHDREAFLEVRQRSSRVELSRWMRSRSEDHRTDLNLTAADADLALGAALSRLDDARLTAPQQSLRRIALTSATLLEFDGRELILRVDDREPGREILRWRFISLLIPGSILAASAAAASGRLVAPAKIRLLHPSMAPDGPVAQQHLHQSASVTFDRLWASVRIRAILEPTKLQRSLRSKRAFCPGLHKGHCPRCMEPQPGQRPWDKLAKARHMDLWLGQLHRAFVASEVLRRHSGHHGPLERCDHCRVHWRSLNNLLPARAGTAPVRTYPWERQTRKLALDLRRAKAARSLHGARRSRDRDILDRLVDEESATLVAAFRRLDRDEPDPHYAALLLQYLRIKTATFRMIVQPPGRHGLKKFLHHFSQIETYQPGKTSIGVQAAQSSELDLRSTEYRVSPDDWLEGEQVAARASRRKDRRADRASENQDAVLIHFQRSEPEQVLPLFGANTRKLNFLADRISNTLARDPRRLIDLRGVDICGVEEHQPLWVSAQTLSRLRLASSTVAAKTPPPGLPPRAALGQPSPTRMKIEPLRVTMHTGEDFTWLTTGVRTVAEPFRWRVIRRGDRIGHGLAVTLAPAVWWKRREGDVVEVSDFDRLQDLGFLASYTRSADDVSSSLKAQRAPKETFGATVRNADQERWLADEIDAVLARLNAAPSAGEDPVMIASDLWTAIGSPVLRRLQSSRTSLPARAPAHLKLLHTYLWSKGLQRRANEPRPLRVHRKEGQELTLLKESRKMVIRHLARWQIPIESNPSSNLVVGSLDAVSSQSFLARSSQQARKPGRETLAWTISTDDPITFATNLADEYAYAWAGMVLRADDPYDPAHARALLEDAAATSMRTRFAARPA